MKAPITFTIMAILLIIFLLGTYQPREEHGYSSQEVSQLNQLIDKAEKPVVPKPKKPHPLLDLFADDGKPVNPRIKKREAIASMIDNGTSLAASDYAQR